MMLYNRKMPLGVSFFICVQICFLVIISGYAQTKGDNVMGKASQVPRPEYPRPQMVRSEWMNLNGVWDFEIDHGGSGKERGLDQGTSYSLTILVPFCPESELSGVNKKDFMNHVWYSRSFQAPENWNGKRILLHCGAVDYDTTIWINGKKAGFHRGGYSPFSCDITSFVSSGDNRITIHAFDDTRSPLQPKGKQSPRYDSFGCLYTRTTGIWQTVWLEPVSKTYIRSFKFFPDIAQKKLTVSMSIEGASEGMALKTRILDQGKEVGAAEIPAGSQKIYTIDMKEIKPWDLENPFLYDIEFTLFDNGKQIDKVTSYYGFREITIDGYKVLLNEKPVFQRLVLDQGFYPDGIYTAPDDEALRKDIELSMAMGFNGARLHQKVFEPRFLYWADNLGYLCWGEYPNWGIDHAKPLALERILTEWLEVLERDFNHPSIVGWCPFNETSASQNSELLRMIYRTTKSIDPTRPVIDTSGYVHVETDIYDCHNYEQNPERFIATFEDFKTSHNVFRNHPNHDAPYKGEPYFVSEYGGIWWNPGQADEKSWGYGDRPKEREDFLNRYRGLTEALLFHPRMFAFCYTQLYDIELEVNGLYTYSRQPKFDPKLIREINSQPAAIEIEK